MLIDSGLEPNVYTYAVFIDYAARSGQAAEAQGYFDEMVQQKILPNVPTVPRILIYLILLLRVWLWVR